jgi:hypothetical protein
VFHITTAATTKLAGDFSIFGFVGALISLLLGIHPLVGAALIGLFGVFIRISFEFYLHRKAVKARDDEIAQLKQELTDKLLEIRKLGAND